MENVIKLLAILGLGVPAGIALGSLVNNTIRILAEVS
jgi:hypothetical protein